MTENIRRGGNSHSWYLYVGEGEYVVLKPLGGCKRPKFDRRYDCITYSIKEEDIPDEVWAALAEWRLLNG